MPDREAEILENLQAYQERLQALDETIREETKDVDRKVIIFHEAFPYFAEACGLTAAAVVNKEPEDDLSSAQLSRLLKLIDSETSLPLIIKSMETDRSVEVLVNEKGLHVCELDPMTTGPGDPPLDYYETVMLQNMLALQDAAR